LACSDAVDGRRHDECGGDVDGETSFDGYDICGALPVDLEGFAFLLVGKDWFGIAENVGFRVRACDWLITEV